MLVGNIAERLWRSTLGDPGGGKLIADLGDEGGLVLSATISGNVAKGDWSCGSGEPCPMPLMARRGDAGPLDSSEGRSSRESVRRICCCAGETGSAGGDDAGSGFVDARSGGERTGGATTADGPAATVLFCDCDSGEGAWRPRKTVDECETVARCGAGTFATVVVVAIADFERFVVICRGRIGDMGGDRGLAMIAAESSRLQYDQELSNAKQKRN